MMEENKDKKSNEDLTLEFHLKKQKKKVNASMVGLVVGVIGLTTLVYLGVKSMRTDEVVTTSVIKDSFDTGPDEDLARSIGSIDDSNEIDNSIQQFSNPESEIKNAEILDDIQLGKIKYVKETLTPEGKLISFKGFNFFRRSSFEVSPGGKKKIREIVKELKKGGAQIKVSVIGHTDSTPIFHRSYRKWNTNEELSRFRASAIKDLMVDHGISQERIFIEKQGEFDRSPSSSSNRSITIRLEQI